MNAMDMPMEQLLHMNEGVGESSYANNSLVQKKVVMRARPILEESIKKIYCTILPTCLKVADLGCSSGPNALMVLSNIMDIVAETSRRLKLETPKFQCFLNDLFGNDFNAIFKSLPQFYHTLKQDKAEKHTPICFIHATPGTFYGTLFPSNSIHYFHSSFSVHFLSQAPKWSNEEAEIEDDHTPPSCAEQFEEDFKLFLRLRSQELIPGGGMLLTFIGRYDASENITYAGLVHMVLNDMVSENLIEEATLKCFSLPFYAARADEVREIIKEEGSFSVERLESIRTSWDGSSLDEDGNKCFVDDDERGEFIAKYLRAIFEPLLKAHFGEGIMEEVFLRSKNKVVQLLPKLEYPALVISLTKIA